ncbi:MAG TPA: hypothetical protein VKB61_00320 [Candidatus Acidoferrum sp.]|nr:hypothetical protein [Candidatus Acidoferrum sp.]
MKHNTMLTVASLLSILLLTLHITDDIVRGISKAESSNTALLILAVFLYGTLVLRERRSGHVIMLFIGLCNPPRLIPPPQASFLKLGLQGAEVYVGNRRA